MEHVARTFSSSMANFFLIALLTGAKTDEEKEQTAAAGEAGGDDTVTVTADEEDKEAEDNLLMSHVSQMISNVSGVISSECPAAMQEIATAIEDKERFLALDTLGQVAYLRDGSTRAADLFRAFLERHGHRGNMEFDMAWPVWEDQPEVVIESIKMMLRFGTTNLKETAANQDPDGILTGLNLSAGKRLFIKWAIQPLVQMRIRQREETKWNVIKAVNAFRKAFRHLGGILAHEDGLLPDPKMIFQMSFTELEDLIVRGRRQPNPRLIGRIKLRLRAYEKSIGDRYPLFIHGPEFLTLDELAEAARGQEEAIQGQEMIQTDGDGGRGGGEVSLSGMPVYAGRVRGRAFVARTLQDVTQAKAGPLQKGDILITLSTDIAWSPVFPLLGGIVTENGGIVSHGAVIAREYAIPCLIAVKNATLKFATGQMVELDSFRNQLRLVN